MKSVAMSFFYLFIFFLITARVCVLLIDARNKMLLMNSMVASLGCSAVLLSAAYYQKKCQK